MSPRLDEFLRIYRLPSGRAVFAMAQAVEVAGVEAPGAIAERAQAALDRAHAAHDLERRYRLTQALPQYGPKAVELDGYLDRALGSLDRVVAEHLALAEGILPDAAKAQAAGALAREMFPRGLATISSMSFYEEHVAVNHLLGRLTGAGDLAGAVAALGIEPFVEQVAAVNALFGPEVTKKPKADGPTWDEIRAARDALHQSVLKYVAVVLGTYPDEDDASLAKRRALLDPVLVQQEALTKLYRSRRGAQDIHPTTGDLLPETVDLEQPAVVG
jgi:hypothetical protein